MAYERDKGNFTGEKLEKGWRPAVTGGFQPEKNELGPPPTGGGGGKEPEKKGS